MRSNKSIRQQELFETYQETFPVRTPDAIQSHGVLIAVHPSSFKIKQISQNTLNLLGVSPRKLLGKSLKHFLAEEQFKYIKSCLSNNVHSIHPIQLLLSIEEQPKSFDGTVHRTENAVILELESSASAPTSRTSWTQQSFNEFHSLTNDCLNRMNQVTDLNNYLSLVTEEVRLLTGYDRVLLYRFDQDGAGIVEAESKNASLPSYLGLRFPAIDIPQVARDLFYDNPVRMIVDVDSQPVALISNQQSKKKPALDLGNSILRAASPCHLEYLKNMEVSATLIAPLIKNQTLWGLISCHHQTPKQVSYSVRTAVGLIAQIVSAAVANKSKQYEQIQKVKLQALRSKFIATMMQAKDLTTAFEEPDLSLLSLVSAQGAAVCLEQKLILLGQTPSENKIRTLLSWIWPQIEDNLFYTDALVEQYPAAEDYIAVASGMLFLQISKIRHYAILWFRPEVIRTVQWAGDPTVEVETGDDGIRKLHPRHSFALWKETVRHCSSPWEPYEIENVLELKTDLVGLVLNKFDELAALNLNLQRRNQELDSFAYAASHDLKEPLRGIFNYATFLQEDYQEILDDSGSKLLETILTLAKRMDAYINALQRLAGLGQSSITLKNVDLHLVLKRAISLLNINFPDINFEVHEPQQLPTAICDGVLIEEVLINLLINALKYNNSSKKRIEVGYVNAETLEIPDEVSIQHEAAHRIYYVKDNGIGIRERHQKDIFRLFKRLHAQNKYGGGTGAGLSIIKTIIERHCGHIWVDSTLGKGTTFYFNLGIERGLIS